MKLYGFPPSPNTWQVRALASYLGVPLEFEFVDLSKGGSQTPAFLAINPTGRTPALVDGDFKLWETMAIMQYTAGKKPNALWPNDSRMRADITRWQSWTLAHWNRDAWAPVPTRGRSGCDGDRGTRRAPCRPRRWRRRPTSTPRAAR